MTTLTTEEILKIARQAGFQTIAGIDVIEFAKLVEAAEREACADMVFRYISQTDNMEARGCLASVAHDIRARGEA